MKNSENMIRTPLELWKQTKKKSLCLFLSLLWAPTILGVIGQVVAHLPVVSSLGGFVRPIVLVTLFLLSFPQIKGDITFKDLLFYFFMAALFGLSYISSQESRPFLDEKAVSFFVMSLPFFYVGLLFRDEDCMDWFYYASFVTVLLSALYNVFYISRDDYAGEAEIIESNMAAAYNLLPHLLMVIWYTLKHPSLKKIQSIINIVVVALGCFLLVAYGSRGPIVCLFVFLFLYFFFFKDFKNPVMVRIAIILIGVVFFLYLPLILDFLFVKVTNIGFDTRVIDFLIAGDFLSDSSGRDYIIETLSKHFSVFPHGIGGAYPLVYTYAHNLAFDLWIDFGYLIGTIILILLLYIIIRTYFRLKGTEFRVFLCILLVCGFISMFLSKSYLSEPFFYFLIGFCINTIRMERKGVLLLK